MNGGEMRSDEQSARPAPLPAGSGQWNGSRGCGAAAYPALCANAALVGMLRRANGALWETVRTRDQPQAVGLGLVSGAGCGFDVALATTETTLRYLPSHLIPEQ
ncbi:hypothetical protein HEK616_35150 [Streptomyces nigrescens]|uniref:Uncharacterized protein n=1 Tax=Streptomyces nigrescens TaxID=1920 RepID=A0ABM7ZUI2_STRNI|nr:hypothetical protein HEK616_35150 [Streptomyces nigrescens]